VQGQIGFDLYAEQHAPNGEFLLQVGPRRVRMTAAQQMQIIQDPHSQRATDASSVVPMDPTIL